MGNSLIVDSALVNKLSSTELVYIVSTLNYRAPPTMNHMNFDISNDCNNVTVPQKDIQLVDSVIVYRE